jgi:hypothetical protein
MPITFSFLEKLYIAGLFLINPTISEIINKTIKIINSIFAIPTDVAAIPLNPNMAATIAMIRNITAQVNITPPLMH